MSEKARVLLIYTGGTIGMIENAETGNLSPFEFSNILSLLPEISRFNVHIEAVSTREIIDSSNLKPELWQELTAIIQEQYNLFDGFVVLHGTDTMAYTASALSFMLEGLNKPIILTGSQLPIGKLRTDGKENLITSIEIAAQKWKSRPLVNEVCIYFENRLLRGNRTHKRSAEEFDAFESPNYPPLAEVGIEIKYNFSALRKWRVSSLHVYPKLHTAVGIIHLFPGISKAFMEATILHSGIKGLILYTYGAGNAPTDTWFLQLIREAIAQKIVVYNVSQCATGKVIMGKYETSEALKRMGVVSGADITLEAAICKLMFVLANYSDMPEIEQKLGMPLRGELSPAPQENELLAFDSDWL